MTNPTEPLYKLNRTRDSLCFFWICWLTYFCTYLGRLNFSASMAEIISAEGFSKSALGMVSVRKFFLLPAGLPFCGVPPAPGNLFLSS